jgi:hypothetical protein
VRRLRDLTRAQRLHLLSIRAASAVVYVPQPRPRRYIGTRIAEGILYALAVLAILAVLITMGVTR